MTTGTWEGTNRSERAESLRVIAVGAIKRRPMFTGKESVGMEAPRLRVRGRRPQRGQLPI